jgi:hypothetical protein
MLCHGAFPPLFLGDELEGLPRELRENLVPEHNHAHGGNRQLPPAALICARTVLFSYAPTVTSLEHGADCPKDNPTAEKEFSAILRELCGNIFFVESQVFLK